jgi:hypothetical protein
LVLLLNAVRALITLLGLILVDAFRRAYSLEGLALIVVLSLVLFVVFVVTDITEEALLAYFNKDEAA